MKKDWNPVEILSHARHDWLNQIQLIKGNLSLNNVERAKEIIEEITYQAQQQSKLSNLKMPQFAELLLTYNWHSTYIQLEFEVFDEKKKSTIKIDEKQLTDWTSLFLEKLNGWVKPFAENHLSITIDICEQGSSFFFDFRGIIVEREQLEQFLRGYTFVKMNELSSEDFSLELFMPFLD